MLAALLVQTDFPSDNSILRSEINPNFSLSKRLSIVPVTHDESYIVRGKEGGILFSVLKNLPTHRGESGSSLRWFALLFAISALFSDLERRKRLRQFFFAWGGLTIIWMIALYFSGGSTDDAELFSPNLYADFGLFGSMADLIITHLYIFMVMLALFIIRKSLALTYMKSGKHRIIS